MLKILFLTILLHRVILDFGPKKKSQNPSKTDFKSKSQSPKLKGFEIKITNQKMYFKS